MNIFNRQRILESTPELSGCRLATEADIIVGRTLQVVKFQFVGMSFDRVESEEVVITDAHDHCCPTCAKEWVCYRLPKTPTSGDRIDCVDRKNFLAECVETKSTKVTLYLVEKD